VISRAVSTFDNVLDTIDWWEKDMPIPPFDGILNVLPPHLGNPTRPAELSPYVCTAEELCQRFATSPARKEILDGFLRLRQELMRLGIEGFQWLDGSFLEDIETQESRNPVDIDVVTFISRPDNEVAITAILSARRELWYKPQVKSTFRADHFLVPLCCEPETLVESTRYWYGLFSHRRDPDRVWKGMLRIELAATDDDNPAWQVLRSTP
jgi:hypothetical protein